MFDTLENQPISYLYNKVKPKPLKSSMDLPAGIGLAVGTLAMALCLVIGLAAKLLPQGLFETLRLWAHSTFLIGLIAVLTSGILSVIGMARGFMTRAHICRFDEQHLAMDALASEVASDRPDAPALLHSVQFYLRMITRVHDQLPVFIGLMTGVATATSLVLEKNSALAADDLAWAAAGAGLGASISRMLAFLIQDRMMRVEHVLQVATRPTASKKTVRQST